MQEIADVLRQERDSLERLAYRLTVLRALLVEQADAYLSRAAAEVEDAHNTVRESDLLRAAQVQLSGVRSRQGAAPTLRQLAALAPEPWARIFRDEHDATTDLVADIEVIRYDAAERARRGIRRVAEQLNSDRLFPERSSRPSEGTARGTFGENRPAMAPPKLSSWMPVPFDDDLSPDDMDLTLLTTEAAYQDALTAVGKLQIPSLIAFLR